MYLVLHHGDLELLGVPLTKARVFPNNDPNSTPASKLSFTITTSSGASHSYACPTITERDAWVKSIAYVSRNLSEETQVPPFFPRPCYPFPSPFLSFCILQTILFSLQIFPSPFFSLCSIFPYFFQ